jgi:hypothetical protein
MKKKDDTSSTPKAPAPIVVPNPGQIFEEPAQAEGETGTASDEPAQGPV